MFSNKQIKPGQNYEKWNFHKVSKLDQIKQLDLAFNNVKPKDRYFVLD